MNGKKFKSIGNFSVQFDWSEHTISNIPFKCFVENNHVTISSIKFKGGKLVNDNECEFVGDKWWWNNN